MGSTPPARIPCAFAIILSSAIALAACTADSNGGQVDAFVPGSLTVSYELSDDCTSNLCTCQLSVKPDHQFLSTIPESERGYRTVSIGSRVTWTGLKPEAKQVFFVTNAASCNFSNNPDVNSGYQDVVTIEPGKTTQYCVTHVDYKTLRVEPCGTTDQEDQTTNGCSVNLDVKADEASGVFPRACYTYPNELVAKSQCEMTTASNPALSPVFGPCAPSPVGSCQRPNSNFTYYYGVSEAKAKANCELESGAIFKSAQGTNP